jgi:hypothetical protein
MDPEVFLAILAMDAYTRPGTTSQTTVKLQLPEAAQGGAIGDAYVYAPTSQSDIPGDSFLRLFTIGMAIR